MGKYIHIFLCHLKEHISSNSPVTMNILSIQILAFKYHSLRESGPLGEVVNPRAGAEKNIINHLPHYKVHYTYSKNSFYIKF